MRVRLKGINTVRSVAADGSAAVYYYHRASGKRLVGMPGTAEFVASFEEAGRAVAQARSAGTVAGLIRQYCDSQQWARLAESTRAIGRLNLKAVETKWGTTSLKHVENPKSRAVFLRWHDELATTQPRAADNKLAALARVFSWSYDRGLICHNPLTTFERAYRNSRAEIIWLPEHVEAFERVASPELRLGLQLALHTGQRQGDLLRLPWSAFDGHAITLRQGKSRRRVWIPCTNALLAALASAPRRATTILTKPDGTPWTKSAFHHAWVAAFAETAIAQDLHFHDLRGTAVTMLSEVGCTPQEIATITGWTIESVNRIAEKYQARTKALARAAVVKLNTHARNAK